jgi:hypothetical protein
MNHQHMPEAAQAIVEEKKLIDYLLNNEHPIGKGKAKFFGQHGFSKEQASRMVKALCHHAKNNPVINVEENQFGKKYSVACNIQTPDERDPCILSVWIVEGGKPPRLVTAYPSTQSHRQVN